MGRGKSQIRTRPTNQDSTQVFQVVVPFTMIRETESYIYRDRPDYADRQIYHPDHEFSQDIGSTCRDG